jgi:16S rRNA (adenine1518-N6/adenine1519-N6)-dimethyltransferase
MKVKPKKHLGQHFLTDKQIAADIVGLLSLHHNYTKVLEIGPGMGVLTDFLVQDSRYETHLIDIDTESVAYLKKNYPALQKRVISGDFLKLNLGTLFEEPFAIIGNFPYNISSQILFHILDYKDKVPEVVCMLQKEVAERIASPPGNRDSGILSVLLQAYYTITYQFTVPEHVFDPQPKVKSGVIRLQRNKVAKLDCDERVFKRLIKQGFNNRRKTLRNALKPLALPEAVVQHPLMDKRAEQLSVADFVLLAQLCGTN